MDKNPTKFIRIHINSQIQKVHQTPSTRNMKYEKHQGQEIYEKIYKIFLNYNIYICYIYYRIYILFLQAGKHCQKKKSH